MTDMGRRAGPGDMKKEDYDVNEDGVVDEVIAHKASHHNGGSDEVNVAGLSGALADEQPSSWAGVSGKPATFTPAAHKASHQIAGADEVSVAELSGALADEQLSSWAGVSGKPATFAPAAHKASHENGGADEIDATGLAGTGGAGLLVDGVSGRTLRVGYFGIQDGTNPNTVKCRVTDRWNGHTIAYVDNIAKNATTGDFALSSAGVELTILSTGLSGTLIAAWGAFRHNKTNAGIRVSVRMTGSGIMIHFTEANAGTDHDITGSIQAAETGIDIFYITDA